MAASLFVPSIGREGRAVGMIVINATITNELDVGAADRGFITGEDVRSVEIRDILVDTGATTLGLPIGIIRALGLRHFRDVHVRTASGEMDVGLCKDATLTVQGRSGTFECLELAEGATPLLGCIPMEMLGLEPDLRNRSVRLLPDWGPDTYFALL